MMVDKIWGRNDGLAKSGTHLWRCQKDLSSNLVKKVLLGYQNLK